MFLLSPTQLHFRSICTKKGVEKDARQQTERDRQTLFSYIVITNETWRGQTGQQTVLFLWCLENKDLCSVMQDRLLFHFLDILRVLKSSLGLCSTMKNRAEGLWDLFVSSQGKRHT